MKISAKINTMQNIKILHFVRSLSLTNWRNACGMVRFPTLQLTNEERVFRLVSVQMVDILSTFCEQTFAQICIFNVFLV